MGYAACHSAEEAVEKYRDLMVGAALSVLRNRGDAEDAAQEASIKVLLNFHTYDQSRRIEPWLYRIATNAAHDFRRRKRKEVGIEVLDILDYAKNPALSYEAVIDAERILAALDQKDRYVLQAAADGMSGSEIAKNLHIPEGTLKTRVRMAREKARHLYQ